MITYARFDDILTVGYIFIQYAKFSNLVPFLRHLYRQDEW